jgi:ATP-dependent RNA helicase DeaD
VVVIDHLERGTLKLDNVTTLILDEADEMISMGFRDELETILKKTPREKSQTWLFSATMSQAVRRVADKYLRKPKQVQVNRSEMLSGTVEQIYYSTKESDKPDILCKLIDVAEDFYGIVFCQTKVIVKDLTQYLTSRLYRVDCLHGDMDQNARERTMQAFRDRRVNMLVCTDVASRGLDVKDVTHVINYSLPRELDSYVHRIGRTARSGKKGFAMSLVTPSHRNLIYRLEQLTKTRIAEGKLPTRKEVAAKKTSLLLPSFTAEKFHARALEVMGPDWLHALETMSTTEVASRFIAMTLPDIFAERQVKPLSPLVREPAAERPSQRRHRDSRSRPPSRAHGSTRRR